MRRVDGILLVCYGNLARLDDGLGAAFAAALEAKAREYADREPGSEDTNQAYYLWWEGEHEVLPVGDLA